MRIVLLTLVFSLMLFIVCTAQKTPKRELRGVWISTHLSLDWPTPSQTPAQQRTAMLSILDQHKATGMNVIYFQVRNQCDALYPSAIEPWSSTLTGTQGKDPGWDPLQFVIEECHKRGMELHAWINPYRAVATASQLPGFVAGHVAKQHPEWLLSNGATITLNPGIVEVRKYITSVILDIASRYDVDGIHFDDYFYPPAPFNDDAAFTDDPRGFPSNTVGRADWRRDNINLFIHELYTTLTSLKPWVKFGVSPSGIYRSSTNPAIGSNTSSGANQHYSSVYADSKLWLQSGWVDYIAPQVYWYIGQAGSDYKILIPWWNDQATNGRHIYIGQAVYKVNDAAQGAPWLDRSQIPDQMRMNRDPAYPNIYGEIAFRTAFLRSNLLNVRDSIRSSIYKRPALAPSMPWRDDVAPEPPGSLVATQQPDHSYLLNWEKPPTTINELDKARQFVIYRSESSVIDSRDTSNILAITSTDVDSFVDSSVHNDKTYYYAVSSVDRLSNESALSNVSDYLPPTIIAPADQSISLNSSCSAVLPDYSSLALVTDDVTTPENIIVTQFPAAGTVINGTGQTMVSLTAMDASGKEATCSFIVTATDVEAPELIVPADITVSTGKDQCGAIVHYNMSASDHCSAVDMVTDFPSGSSFAKGSTIVTVTAIDEAGNKTTRSFIVTVIDQQAPRILCPEDKFVITEAGVRSAYIDLHQPDVSDNCPGIAVEGKRNDGAALSDAYPKGTTVIKWTATDAEGNKASCTQNITVQEKEAGKLELYVNKELLVSVFPNPSLNQFTIVTLSRKNESLQISVSDINGRIIETRKGIAANGIIQVGANYRPGIYVIEIKQGNNRVTLKLVKL